MKWSMKMKIKMKNRRRMMNLAIKLLRKVLLTKCKLIKIKGHLNSLLSLRMVITTRLMTLMRIGNDDDAKL